MSRVFITGIAGFLGSVLAEKLVEMGHQVSGCDNLIGGSLENIEKVKNDIEFYEADCCDHEKMIQIMAKKDILLHLACYPHEGLSSFSPWIVTQSVSGASASVFSAAIKHGYSRILFATSMARYGTNITPFTENLQPLPVDPYGVAKVASEDNLKILAKTHDVDYAIFVPHNLYGYNQRYWDPMRNVLGIFINLMLHQKRQPTIYGDGSQTRCFTYIDDAVSCIIKMCFQSNVVGKTINIGPDTEFISIANVAKTIAELLDFPLNPIFMPDRPNEVHTAVCSSNLARELLDYKTTVSLRQGLIKMIEHVKDRGPRDFEYHLPIEIPSDKCPKTWTKKLF